MINIGAVILAGGMSSRMGYNKAFLKLEGQTFLNRIANQLDYFREIMLSVDDAAAFKHCDIPIVEDIFPCCGPMGGLYSALRQCKTDWLFAISCDMPLFQYGLVEYLSTFISDDYDALIPVTRDGRIQPLCGIYSKYAADIFEELLNKRQYKMISAIECMKVKFVPLSHSAYEDETVSNINTPDQYAALCTKVQGPPIIAVCGIKNSGKTTLLENVLPFLRKKGASVAVIKHDGHDFIPDVPGTDSYRMRAAGADAVAVFSECRFMISMEQQNTDFHNMVKQFPFADLILIEGGKHTSYPKIELVRSGISDAPASSSESLIAICSDLDIYFGDVQTLSLVDYDRIANIMFRYTYKQQIRCSVT